MPRFHLTIKRHADGLPPCQSATIGKLDFRVYTTVHSQTEGVPDTTYEGAVGEYDEKDVAEFREVVKHFVVRWGFAAKRNPDGTMGPSRLRSATVHDTRVKNAIRTPKFEEPLGLYLDVRPINLDDHQQPVGVVTPEQAAAEQESRASEERARASDPSDGQRRARHGRAKATGEGVEG